VPANSAARTAVARRWKAKLMAGLFTVGTTARHPPKAR